MRIYTLSLREFPDGVLEAVHIDAPPPPRPDGAQTLPERVLAALRLKALSFGLKESRLPFVPDAPEHRTECGVCADYEFGLRAQLEALQQENERLS
ncbi:MAG: hypothetical protein ABFD89_28095, partial [Bryobacteraceae bacterium]